MFGNIVDTVLVFPVEIDGEDRFLSLLVSVARNPEKIAGIVNDIEILDVARKTAYGFDGSPVLIHLIDKVVSVFRFYGECFIFIFNGKSQVMDIIIAVSPKRDIFRIRFFGVAGGTKECEDENGDKYVFSISRHIVLLSSYVFLKKGGFPALLSQLEQSSRLDMKFKTQYNLLIMDKIG